MTVILGLNAFHPDSSACLVVDGKLVNAVAEERLGDRQKHTMAFPENAIRWVLRDAGLRLRDVTHVAVARQPRSNLGPKARYLGCHPVEAFNMVWRFASQQHQTAKTIYDLPEICGENRKKVKYKFYPVEHHIAHISSSYFVSPFEAETAAFSYDGSGDFATAMAARCKGSQIEVLDKVTVPNSLGHFYTAMCQFIGFDHFGEEYKVMGLAPYGDNAHDRTMADIVRLEDVKWFELNSKYFTIRRGMAEAHFVDGNEMRLGRLYSDALVRELGAPRHRSDDVTQREKDIARSTQERFEQAAIKCLDRLSKQVSLSRLAMAGGCALNGVTNARIYRELPVDDMYLQCAASDDGTAIGAAFHCWHIGIGKTERFEMKHAFWGPEYPESRMQTAIESTGREYYLCVDEDELVNIVADNIAEGAVVGWYQGRSEWGPRALGNRSILANPAVSDMKDTINRKIKKRESFRPFAPSVLREEVGRFFEQDIASPFMMHVVKFKPEWRDTFPAVVHVDGTGRLQTVEKENNLRYYKLIAAVKRRTGYGIVLNTSFNENEPVVDTPEQAINCFERTDMDMIVIGRYVVQKKRI